MDQEWIKKRDQGVRTLEVIVIIRIECGTMMVAKLKDLGLPSLLKSTRQLFEQISDDTPRNTIPLSDHLMSGLAVFGLKYPSLLQFDQDRNANLIRTNLKNLYSIRQAPSDTLPQGTIGWGGPAQLA